MKKINTAIKILIAEHDKHDLEMIVNELKSSGIDYVTENVVDKAGYRNALTNFLPDVILCDYTFPSFDGRAAFAIREQVAPETPFILVSGAIGEEYSIELIKNGVTDFVLKDKLFTLNTKLVRALKDAEYRKQKDKTVKELAQNERLLARAQQVAQLGSWELNFDDNELRLSVEGARLFGFTPDQNRLSFETWSSLVHPEDIDEVLQTIQQSRDNLTDTVYYHRIILKDGTLRDIYSESKFEFDESGKAVGLYGIMQDITDRKKNEAAIKKAYDEMNTVLESIDDGFFALDKNSVVTYWNRRAEILLDIKKEDLIGKNLHEVFIARGSRIFYDNYLKALKEKITINFEGFSNISKKWFAVSAFGSDNGLSVYFKDVTERKNDEEKLQESELRYRSLIEQATDTICIADSSSKFIEVNPSGCLMFGYSKEEVLQLSITDVLFEEDLKTNPIQFEELRAGKTTSNERRIKRKDGSATTVELNAKMLEGGRILIFGRDISERKESERLVKESEAKFRSFFESSMDGILLTVTDGEILAANPAACVIFKMTEQEICAAGRFGIVDVSDPRVNILVEERQRTGRAKGELTLLRKDGSKFQAELTSAVFTDSFGMQRTSMIIRDVSDRIKLEKTLEAEQQRFAGLYLHAPSSMGILKGPNHVYETANPLYLQLIGKIDIIGKPVKEVLPEMEDQGFLEILDNVYKTGETFSANEMLVQFDRHGTGKLVDTYLNFIYQAHRDDQNEIDGILFFAIDVTEQVLSRKKIEESENRFRAIIEKSAELITLSTKEGKLLYISPSILKVFGYNLNELNQLSGFDFIHPDDFQDFFNERQKILDEDGVFFSTELRLLHKNGNWIWCDATLTNMLHEPGVHAMVSNFTDISAKKFAEQQMEFDRNNLDALINNTNDLMWSVDKDFNLIASNKPFEEMNRVNFAKFIPKGGNVLLAASSSEMLNRFKILYERAFAGESFTEVEHFDSPVQFWTEISYYPIRNGDEVIGTACHSRDITDRKMAEVNLRRSEKRYRQILETAQEGIWLIDENSKTTFVNDKMCEILEYTKDEMIGRTNLSFKDEEEQKNALLQSARRKQGLRETHEARFVTKSGKHIWTQVSTSPLLDEDGRYVGALAMITNITERKIAEKKISESELKYRSLIEQASDAIIVLNTQGALLEVNTSTEILFGYGKDELLKMNVKDLVFENDVPPRNDEVENGKTIIYERKMKKKDETAVDVEISARRLPDKRIFAMFRDITERKKTELAIKESENYLRTILDTEPECVKVLNRKGELLSMNPAGLAMIEADNVQQVLGHCMTELIDKKYLADFNQLSKEVFDGNPGNLEFEITGLKGGHRWLETHAVPLKDTTGKITNLLGVTRDITERKKGEEERKRLTNRLLLATKCAGMGIWDWDIPKDHINWDEGMHRLYKINASQFGALYEGWLMRLHPEDKDRVNEEIQMAITGKKEYDTEFRIIRGDLSVHYIKATGITEKDTEGNIIRLLGVNWDITEEKLAEIHLHELNKNLQKHTKELAISNAELEQFAYVASHDLQEPLRMVTSFLTQLDKRYGDIIDDKGKKYIDFAVDGAKRMRQIILDLLEFSRVGRTEDEEEELDLNELLHEIKILLRKKIEENKAEIIIDTLPQIKAHRSPLRQVFQNLLSNALKYSYKDIPAKIHITVKEFKDHWQFAVIDNGIGIEKEYFDRIFIIFQRLHNKDEYSGTGMGLAITKKIIETQGGNIWVESEVGKGSAFYFTVKK